ncbi:MAG: metallophosphoesterase [Faecalibacterium sp.]|nr:metallophosphoesterase [Ruminococcus sp.]MCM1393035.1 metallophosphoesterase [Ruminococcus sp.]MCM1484957.1 metallophosphoesterase [Faecalibacterium sp.]
MSLFALGDTHLSFGTNKPMDIFRGWNDYEKRLEKNWRAIVNEDDTVVIAGDISWAMKLEEAVSDFKFLNSLPGRKIIMKGNHDYWWQTKKKLDEFVKANDFDTIEIMFNNAFKVGDFVVCGSRGWFYDAEKSADMKVLKREAGRLKMSIDCAKQLGGEPIVFLHYPPVTQTQECEEIMNVLKSEDIKRCYYGHLHGESTLNSFNGIRDEVEFRLISADYLGFCPKLIEKF